MKKGKVFGKTHIAVAVMALGLAVSVWLNMKFSPSGKYMGEASYVSGSKPESGVVQTSAKVKKTDDYFENVKSEREKSRSEISESVEEMLKSDKLTEEEKNTALQKTEEYTKRIESELNIETLLKAKGFKKAVAVISDKNVSVVVSSDGLTTAQTMQIQDIVTAETKVQLSNIKIIPVKE